MASERTSEDELPAKWAADRHTLICLSFLGVICVMVAIDATILVPALPTIAEALQGTAAETFWAGSSYLLTNATFQPLIATLSSVLGRRRMLFLSIVIFTIGSLVSCLAQNFPTLLAGRTIKGIGGGGIMALNLVIITDMVPLRYRPKYYVFTQLAWAVGTITGPLIGGAIAEYGDWRILFYINFPFCAVGLVAVLMVPKIGNPGQWSLDSFLRRVDWTGNLLFMAGSTSFLIGITWAGHQYPWDSAQVLAPLIIGLALIVATLAWEYIAASAPFIRRTMLRNRALMTTYVCTMIAGFLMYAHLYYVALFMMSVQSRTALMTGVSVLPIFVGFMPASGSVGAVVQRWGKWKWSLWLGWAINTLGAGLFLLLDKDTPVVAWVFIFLVCGFGQGALISAHNIGVQAIADSEDVAWASALFTFVRSVGLCLGVALGGTVLQTQLSRELEERGLPAEIAEHAESFIFELVKMPANSPSRVAIVDAFSESFRFLFIILLAISGATLLLSFTVRGFDSIHKTDTEELMGTERGIDLEATRQAETTQTGENKPQN